ncbi:MAG: response regulator [Lachnospiraceae bacterium]|nr:response regulator [Lachnospiraceae bacterium]
MSIEPVLASSGEEAIERMEKDTYHIVFLDHMMPKLDGIETLAILKKRELFTAETTMIALTANAIVGAKEKYLEAGFDDYLSKPIEVEELERLLRKYLPQEILVQREENVSSGQMEKDSGVLEFSPQRDSEIMEFLPEEAGEEAEVFSEADRDRKNFKDMWLDRVSQTGISIENGLRYCGGDEAFYQEMLRDYVEVYEKKREEIDSFYHRRDWYEYETAVHALKSTSKTIGANDFSLQARQMEQAAKAGDTGYIMDHYDAFTEEYRSLVEKVKEAFI